MCFHEFQFVRITKGYKNLITKLKSEISVIEYDVAGNDDLYLHIRLRLQKLGINLDPLILPFIYLVNS